MTFASPTMVNTPDSLFSVPKISSFSTSNMNPFRPSTSASSTKTKKRKSMSQSSSTLTAEQQAVLDRAIAYESMYVTGEAGTGKSHLLRRMIKALRTVFPKKNEVIVTAPTGIAAIKIGGTTVHSFAGMGISLNLSAEMLLRKVRSDPRALRRWMMVKVLFIDEGLFLVLII
jgi:ATP-dependent DNA helicase PIF1